MKVVLKRHSISMGDDVLAPNERVLEFDNKVFVQEIFDYVLKNKYLPELSFPIYWEVSVDDNVIGYFKSLSTGSSYKTNVANKPIGDYHSLRMVVWFKKDSDDLEEKYENFNKG